MESKLTRLAHFSYLKLSMQWIDLLAVSPLREINFVTIIKIWLCSRSLLQSLRFKLLPNGADGAHDGLHRAAGDVLPRAWLTFEGRCDDGADRALTRPKHGFESRPGVAHPDPRTLASVKQDPQDRRVFRNLKFVFVFWDTVVGRGVISVTRLGHFW